MECIVLYATQLGLGTCWLGGTFSRSSFSSKADLQPGEILPAVVSFGYPAEKSQSHPIRALARSDRRLPWDELFFQHSVEIPLKKDNPEFSGFRWKWCAWPLQPATISPGGLSG
jgi:hypothetical protein